MEKRPPPEDTSQEAIPDQEPPAAAEVKTEWWRGPKCLTLAYNPRIMLVRVAHEEDEDISGLFAKAIRLLFQERVCFLGIKMTLAHKDSLRNVRAYCIEKPRCQ